jgi:hypothetical protein
MKAELTIAEVTRIRDVMRMTARAERARERPDEHLLSECEMIISSLSAHWESALTRS